MTGSQKMNDWINGISGTGVTAAILVVFLYRNEWVTSWEPRTGQLQEPMKDLKTPIIPNMV
jgi:hypothetical protein